MNTFKIQIKKPFPAVIAPLIILLILLYGCTAVNNTIPVVISPDADNLETLAAQELADNLQIIYPKYSFKIRRKIPENKTAVLLGTIKSFPRLSEFVSGADLQGAENFVVTEGKINQHPVGIIAGSDPRGVLYAVYELLEQMGFGFYLSYNAQPSPDTAPFTFEKWHIADKPLVEERIILNWHNFLSSCSTWDLPEWKQWIIQTSKMKFNTIMVHAYGNNPIFSFSHNGQTKTTGYLTSTFKGRDWGTENVNDVRRLFGGEDVFKGPVFGSKAAFVPEEKRVEAANALMGEVFTFAKSRGMNVILAVDVDTRSANPQNIIMTLPENTRFTSKGYGVVNDIVNPDTPEGYAYYKSQVLSIIKNYPQIDQFALYFRHSYNSLWKSLKPDKFPQGWKTEYKNVLKQYPYLKNDPGTPSIFAIRKIARAFRRALDENGGKNIILAIGSWSFKDMTAAEALFDSRIRFLPLDYSKFSKMDENEEKVKWFRKDRKVSPIHLSHNDDGEYIIRPRQPLPAYASLLGKRNNSGYGILHWTTRFQDVYFKNMSNQVWSSTKNQTLMETCLHLADRTFGEKNAEAISKYLYKWSTEAPLFGRETLDRFIRRPIGNPDSAVAGCMQRLNMIVGVDESSLSPGSRNLFKYLKLSEQWVIDFLQNQHALEQSVGFSDNGDFDKAEEEINKCNPEKVLENYSEMSRLCGITPGEKGLLVSMNLRWLPYFTAQKQLLRMEDIRYNFKTTHHDPLAQQPGKKTFHFDTNKKLWKCLGEEETGAKTFTIPQTANSEISAYEEICSSGIQSDEPLSLSLMTITGEKLQSGLYNIHLFFAEPAPLKAGERVFDVSLKGSENNGSSITDRIDIFKQAGGSKRVLHKTYKLNINQGKLDIELKPVKGNVLICGAVIEPADK